MPKLRSPLLSFLAKGRLGKYTSYRDGPSGPQVIATPTHPDANTPPQQAQRTKFSLGRDWWYDLTPDGKTYFTDPFRALFTPFAAWMKYWLNALVVPHAPQHITTVGDDPLYTDPLITEPNLGQLVDGGETNLHTHPAVGVGVSPLPGFISGRWYGAELLSATSTTAVVSVNMFKLHPFCVPVATTFNRIGIRVATGATGKIRLGVYSDNGGTPTGGGLLLDSGEIDTAVAEDKEVVINLTLAAGWYWLAIFSNTTATLRGLGAVSSPALLGFTGVNVTSLHNRASITATYGPLPNPCPAVTLESGTVYLIMLRKA